VTLPAPNLDDRTFEQLVADARQRAQQSCPDWTDLTVHDPGIALLEAFAYLTDTLIYRLNRLPSKAYIAFLNLIDAQLQPPAAAVAELVFSLPAPQKTPVEIRRGTRVSCSRAAPGGEPVVFTVDQTVQIEPGQTSVKAVAYHAELIEGEVIGRGTGLPGLRLRVKRAPIIARHGRDGDLFVGVEAKTTGRAERVPSIKIGDGVFRVWQPVDVFASDGKEPNVFVADRAAGMITFAPAVRLTPGDAQPPARAHADAEREARPTPLAGVPEAGAQIRAWYWRGGGAGGNVAAGTLDTLKDPVPGASLSVTNPQRAIGGRDAETLENALLRGPAELHSLRRAVTARDFELLAQRGTGAVARAKAFTQKTLWEHAAPGTVDVVLVPDVGAADRGEFHERLDSQMLAAHASEPARADVSRLLDARRPLGTSCVVRYARDKKVAVDVGIAVHRAEDAAEVRRRILQRLHQALSPLPSPAGPGWAFGEPLLKSRVYDLLLAEPGLRYVRNVGFSVQPAPGAIRCLESDRFQGSTWYAGSATRLFRSTNDGQGWELLRDFESEQPELITVHGELPGLLAVAVRVGQTTAYRVYFSRDCGESWLAKTHSLEEVRGLAWISRDRQPILLVATRKGLFELALRSDAGPLQILVHPQKPNLGFTALTAGIGARGASIVAVAAESATEGVFLSTAGGKAGSFFHLGLTDDIRVLNVQRAGPTTYLWVGLAAPGDEDGRGCHRWEVRDGGSVASQSWEAFTTGWQGGSVYGLTFVGSTVHAATHRRGILSIDASRTNPSWSAPEIRVGLPLRQVQDQVFKPVQAVAVGGPSGGAPTLLAGTEEGVFKKTGEQYARTPALDADEVTIPRDWLISSGAHQVTVIDDAGE
jgi:hypothetical protein